MYASVVPLSRPLNVISVLYTNRRPTIHFTVRKLIQKRLNISIQHNKMDPFCGPIITQIFPKMHGLAYKISKIFVRLPNVEHKSAPVIP